MPDDLMTQVRTLLDDGAAPLTLDELRGGRPTELAARRRRGPTIVAAIAVAAACAIGLVVAGVALARDDGGVQVSSPGSGGPDLPVADLDNAVEVFMLLNVTDAQVAAVKADLEASPDVASYVSLDQDAAYREFAAVFSCDADADLVNLIRPENLPLSFRVLTTDPGGVERLQTSLKALPGVALVAQPRSEDYYCKAGPPTLPAAGDPPADATAAHDAVVAAFTEAWDGTNSFDQRRAAMQNFSDTNRLVEEFDQARPGNGTPMRAVVGDVTFVTPERAAVLFHLEFGNVSMPIDGGYAVLQDGTWKVDRETVCTMAQRVGVACAG
jgi:hypothetical protein